MVQKALLEIQGKIIPVMYNPDEYSVTRNAKFKGKGKSTKFIETEIEDLTVNLLFDTYEKKSDVRDITKAITSLVVPTVKGKVNRKPAPCKFIWGDFIYGGYATKVQEKFTMFLASGIPVRSEISLTIMYEYSVAEDEKNKGFGSSRKFWTVRSGDRLDTIAYETLRDPSLWRVIAKENNIHDAASFPSEDMVGTVLVIPYYYHSKGAE